MLLNLCKHIFQCVLHYLWCKHHLHLFIPTSLPHSGPASLAFPMATFSGTTSGQVSGPNTHPVKYLKCWFRELAERNVVGDLAHCGLFLESKVPIHHVGSWKRNTKLRASQESYQSHLRFLIIWWGTTVGLLPNPCTESVPVFLCVWGAVSGDNQLPLTSCRSRPTQIRLVDTFSGLKQIQLWLNGLKALNF